MMSGERLTKKLGQERHVASVKARVRRKSLDTGTSADDALAEDQAALAIENSRLLEQAAARADRMSLLSELSRAANESLDVERVQALVVQSTAELLAADRTGLWLVEEGHDTLVLAAASDREDSPGVRGT